MRIYTQTGREGPRYDPYRYDETVIEGDDNSVTVVHLGLGCYIKQTYPETESNPYRIDLDGSPKQVNDELRRLCGVTLTQVARWLRKRDEANLRQHRTHGGMQWERGFPGESLLFCKCGAVVDSTFDRSAIE